MIELVGGVGTSHVPSIGAAIDNGRTTEPYWKPLFDGYESARAWMAETQPDVAVIVFNDHASAFSLQLVPTFLLGVADVFQPADEGYGPRNVPPVRGHPGLAWNVHIHQHIAAAITPAPHLAHGALLVAELGVGAHRGDLLLEFLVYVLGAFGHAA